MDSHFMKQTCPSCNQEHWIPADKQVCLSCGFMDSHSKKIAAFKEKVVEEYKVSIDDF